MTSNTIIIFDVNAFYGIQKACFSVMAQSRHISRNVVGHVFTKILLYQKKQIWPKRAQKKLKKIIYSKNSTLCMQKIWFVTKNEPNGQSWSEFNSLEIFFWSRLLFLMGNPIHFVMRADFATSPNISTVSDYI